VTFQIKYLGYINRLIIRLIGITFETNLKTALMNKPTSVDEYIAAFPETVQNLLHTLRATIINTAPEAEEVISYSMPAYKQNGMLLFFAAFKNHIGFYPMSSGIEAFKEEISCYKNAKGSVQFPLDKPLPLSLIKRIVIFRVENNKEKLKKKKLS